MTIDWPVAAGQPPLQTTHLLNERCCYWEFYDSGFVAPAGAAVGKATLTVSIPGADFPLELASNTLTIPVKEREADSSQK